MKKYVVTVLLLISLFFLCPFAQAAIPVLNKSGKEVRVLSAAEAAGTLYMLSDDMTLYRLNEAKGTVESFPVVNSSPEYELVTPEMKKEKNILQGVDDLDAVNQSAAGVNLLAGGGDDLYALNLETGALYSVNIMAKQAARNALCWLDYRFEDPTVNGPYLHKAFVLGGQLYALMTRNDESDCTLYCFDMKTGARSSPLETGIWDMAPYRGGQLLLLMSSGLSGKGSALVFSPETGEMQTLDTGKLSGISDVLYDQVLDRAIFFVGNEIVALFEDGSTTVVGYWPKQNYRRMFFILPSGKLAIVDKSVELMDVSAEAAIRKELKVAADYIDFDDFQFTQVHPEILFDQPFVEPFGIQDLFATQITTASPEYDVFKLPLGTVLDSAVEKGYYIPLDVTDKLNERLRAIYPFAAEKLVTGDKIAALPVSIDNQTLAYSRYAASRLGINEAELPTTYGELIAFCLSFDEKYGLLAHEKGITLFAVNNIRTVLTDQLIGGYCELIKKDEKAGRFREAELGSLLDGVKQLQTLPDGAPIIGRSYEPPQLSGHNPPMRYRVNAEPDYLFTLTATVLPGGRHFVRRELVNDFVPIPLRLFEGMKPQLLFTGSVLVINPYSLNPEDAQVFLDYYLQHIPVGDGAALFMDAQPVPERDYEMLKRMYTREIESLTQKRDAVKDEAEKRTIDSQIAASEAGLKTLDAIKWAVREDWISDYRRFLEECEISWVDHSLYETSLKNLLNRFFEGNMDGETCAREISDILVKVISENR